MAVGIRNRMLGWSLIALGVEKIEIDYKGGRGKFAVAGVCSYSWRIDADVSEANPNNAHWDYFSELWSNNDLELKIKKNKEESKMGE